MRNDNAEENRERLSLWNEPATIATVHTDGSTRENGSFQAFKCNGGEVGNWPNGTASTIVEPKSVTLGDAKPDPNLPAQTLQARRSFLPH